MEEQPSKPRFHGRFFRWSVGILSNREKGYEDRLLVFSSGKRAAVLKYLWLKHLWNQLSVEEFDLFLASLTESPRDEIKWAFLRAQTILPKRILRERVRKLERIFGIDESTRESYLGIMRMRVEIHRIRRSLPRVPKYTGWIRSSSALGSKRRGQLRELSDAFPLEFIQSEKRDWYFLLTVGKMDSQTAGPILLYPEESKRGRNG